MPEGVGAATLGYAVIDSTNGQYDNSGHVKNKVEATGFGPLLTGAYNVAGLQFGVLGPVIDSFNALKLRTRGEVYGMAYNHGVSEDVTVGGKFRVGNMRTRIVHKADPAFAQIQAILPIAGFESADDAFMDDRLIAAQLNAAFWLDDEYLDDDTKHQSAFILGYTHRGSWSTGGHDLVEFALTDLARMNRPPFLRMGFEGTTTDEYDGIQLSYGAHLHYHLSGKTREANPAIIISNSNGVGAIPGAQTFLTPIEGVESVSHFGGALDFNASMPIDDERTTNVGLGFWLEYEGNYSLRDVGFSGNPIIDGAFRNTERDAESRGYLRLSLTHSTVEQYMQGLTNVPYIVTLQIDDSVYGRNQSLLQVASLRFTMPLSSPNG
jgi:hypothetical protein